MTQRHEAGAMRARILAALADAPRPALFATELALLLGPGSASGRSGPDGDRGGDGAEPFGAALAGLRRSGEVLVTEHPPPDRHLAGSDLRIVAGPLTRVPRAAAEQAAEALWREWVTEFTAGHRCG